MVIKVQVALLILIERNDKMAIILSRKTRRGINAAIKQYKKALAEKLKPEETGFFLDISYNGDVSFCGLASKAASRLKEEPVMVDSEILCYLREKGFKVYLHCFYGAYTLATLLVFP